MEPPPARTKKPDKPRKTKDEAVNAVRQAEYDRALEAWKEADDKRKEDAAERKRKQQTGYKEEAKKQRAESRAAATEPSARASTAADTSAAVAPPVPKPHDDSSGSGVDKENMAAQVAPAPAPSALPPATPTPSPTPEHGHCYVCGQPGLKPCDTGRDGFEITMKYHPNLKNQLGEPLYGDVCKDCFESFSFNPADYQQWIAGGSPNASWSQRWNEERGEYRCSCRAGLPTAAAWAQDCRRCGGAGHLAVHMPKQTARDALPPPPPPPLEPLPELARPTWVAQYRRWVDAVAAVAERCGSEEADPLFEHYDSDGCWFPTGDWYDIKEYDLSGQDIPELPEFYLEEDRMLQFARLQGLGTPPSAAERALLPWPQSEWWTDRVRKRRSNICLRHQLPLC